LAFENFDTQRMGRGSEWETEFDPTFITTMTGAGATPCLLPTIPKLSLPYIASPHLIIFLCRDT
jgi:hypothetical protein